MVDALRSLDMKTVFGFRELGDAAKMMLNYGVAGQSVVPMLSVISDIAAGDSQKLEGLARAFGQMAATGRLMGQDLNQMINAGFNPLEEISRRTGVSMSVLKKKMEDGGISAEMVARAFESATSAGGRFHGMNDRMSQTTAGQFAKLKSEVELLAIEIGTQLLPTANELITWAKDMVTSVDGVGTKFGDMVGKAKDWFRDIGDNVADMGVVMGATVGALIPHWEGFWAEMRGWAGAFFDYFSANLKNMGEDVGIAARNLQKIVTGKATEKRRMKDDFGRDRGVMEFSTLERFKGGVPLQAPNVPLRKPTGIWESIQAELETARKLRQEARNAAEGRGKKTDEIGDGKDRMAGKSVRLAFASGAKEETGDKSKTFSAEALFANIREGALNKQLGIAKQSLGVQQMSLKAQQEAADQLKKINLGLA
jgi:tape measure domain-containing protein